MNLNYVSRYKLGPLRTLHLAPGHSIAYISVGILLLNPTVQRLLARQPMGKRVDPLRKGRAPGYMHDCG